VDLVLPKQDVDDMEDVDTMDMDTMDETNGK
jgi:hypothetical protein